MSSLKKIVFFVYNPFIGSGIYTKRLGESIFKDNNIEVIVFDFAKILKPELYQHYENQNEKFHKLSKHIVFESVEEAKEHISKLSKKDTLVLDHGTLSYPWVNNEFQKTKVKFGVYILSSGPYINIKRSKASKLIKYVTKNPFLLAKKIRDRFFGESYTYPSPDLCLAGGEYSVKLYSKKYNLSDRTEVVWAHNYDFDKFLDFSDDGSKKKTIAYLDQGIGHNQDEFLAKKSGARISTLDYPSLNKFFDHVEEATGLEVVIAGHPRMSIEHTQNRFPNRRVTHDKTFETVTNSAFVLAHWSTSSQIGIMAKKPVVFIYSNSLKSTGHHEHALNLAQQLNNTPMNIDEEFDKEIFQENLNVSEESYKLFLDKFVKKRGTPHKKVWQILLDGPELERLFPSEL
jgi:hypothetical protein